GSRTFAWMGSAIVIADRWFPSSKLCSTCSAKNELLALTERTWTCGSCGTSHDHDVNAARNLAQYAESSPSQPAQPNALAARTTSERSLRSRTRAELGCT